jgi:hypothetical protein
MGQHAFIAGDLDLRESDIADHRPGSGIGPSHAEDEQGVGGELSDHERSGMGGIDLSHSAHAKKDLLVRKGTCDDRLGAQPRHPRHRQVSKQQLRLGLNRAEQCDHSSLMRCSSGMAR